MTAIQRLTTLVLLLLSLSSMGQSVRKTEIRGEVVDIKSSTPLSFATIFVKGTTIGTTTNEDGEFSLIIPPTVTTDSIIISYIGYNDGVAIFKDGTRNNLKIKLLPTSYSAGTITVSAKRERYKKRNNPAHELALRLINNRDASDPREFADFSYQSYEKIVFALEKEAVPIPIELLPKRAQKRIKFENRFIDTLANSNKRILPMTIKEKISDHHYSKAANKEQQIIKYKRSMGVDNFMSNESVMGYLNAAIVSIDIFNGDIYFMQRHFVGPLSKVAPSYYKYYLRDTVLIDNRPFVGLEFVPRNAEALGFIGHLWVAVDSSNFIKRIQMNVPSKVNLNFINNLLITQEFEQGPQGQRLLTLETSAIDVNLMSRTRRLYVTRLAKSGDFKFTPPLPQTAEILQNGALIIDQSAQNFTPQSQEEELLFWQHMRPIPATRSEDKLGEMVNALRRNFSYRLAEKAVQLIVDGYLETSSKSYFDIGPVLSFINGNTLEGTRLTFGGFTTANLCPFLFFEGYVGYGTLDKQFKYQAALEYSFNRKKHHPGEFPINSLKLQYSYDINRPGRQYLSNARENVMTWLRRRTDNSLTYRRNAELNYTREFKNNFSYSIILRHYTEYETHLMFFAKTPIDGANFATNFGTGFGHFSMSEAEIRLRYAPGELIYQTKRRRQRTNKEAPVFHLSHTMAVKGFLGSNFGTNRSEFMFEKRFSFAPLGYIDAQARLGAQWNQVPYMLLPMPNANLSYLISEGAYALMNPFEFIYDRYISVDISYYLDGLIINRIPLLKRTGLRGVLTFRAIYSMLTNRNNPLISSNLPGLPSESFIMNKGPYMEVGFGFENIFKIFRVDYVRRLSYMNHPGIDKNGVQVTARFKF